MTTRIATDTRLLAALLACLAGCGGAASQAPSASQLPASTLLATIPVGAPPTLLAMSPDGSRVCAASSGQLSIIESSSSSIVATVATAPYPTGVVVTPDGKRVLLDSVEAARLAVIDVPTAATRSPIGLIVDIPPGGFGRIAVTPDGRRAYVTNQVKQYLAVVDLGAGTTTESSLDMRPSDVTLGRDGRTLYVTGCREFCTTGTVEVIDTTTFSVLRSFAVGPGPYRFALSPDETRAYTTNLGGPSLSVIDVASGTTRATLPVGVEPTGLAVSPDGARIYVVSQKERTLTIVDAARSATVGSLSLPNDPREVAVSPDGRRLYVSTRGAVLVLDVAHL